MKMKIVLYGIKEDLLLEIIENIGSLSIIKCEPHIDVDHTLLYDVEFSESVQTLLTKTGVQIIKNERKMFIDAYRFNTIRGI